MSTLYAKGLQDALEAVTGVAAASTGTLKLAFMATTYTPNAFTDQYWSDISASIASGTTAQTLSGAAVNVDSGNTRVEFDTSDISVASQTTTTDKYVIYMDTGTASTSPLIACIDIAEGTLAPVSGTLALTFNAEGHFAVSVA